MFMQTINSFKNFLLAFFCIFFINISASGITLIETPVKLDAPWGMTWLDDNNILITQKSGEIFLINTEDYTQIQIKHDISSVQYGQGGLLDIINDKNTI